MITYSLPVPVQVHARTPGAPKEPNQKARTIEVIEEDGSPAHLTAEEEELLALILLATE